MYKIIGADGKEYGPVTLEQLREWIRQGRVNGETRAQPVGGSGWKAAREIPELMDALLPPLPAASAPGSAPPPAGALPTTSQTKNGLAIASFVLGIVSFALCFGVLTGIPGIICGHVARNRSRRMPEQYGGQGFALAGLVLGYLSLLYTAIIVAMLLPSLLSSRAHAQLTQCTSNMRQVGLALRIWSVDHEGQFPFNLSTNQGGTKELCLPGYDGFDKSAPAHLMVISNELGNTRVLVCPSDESKHPALDFAHLTTENISYLLRTGPGVTDTNKSEMLLKCPLHGTVLRCDGDIERTRPSRKSRL